MPSSSDTSSTPIVVKVMSRQYTRMWLRQLPDGDPSWGPCRFVFDPEAREYDWLVVYDDLPRSNSERFPLREEVLACPREHTLLVTTEPSSIKTYGRAYTAQFGCVLTSQADWALPHPDRIWSQPALHWFYGFGRDHQVSFNRLMAAEPPVKTKDLSMVWSGKSMRHTFHNQRFRFMRDVRAALPEMEVFGRGVRDLDDKAEALDDFRYHIAIENFIGPHHFTEKLSDPFLAFTLPFYCGCPDAADYFPEESFIPIDVTDFGAALETIQRAIRDKEYEKRLPYIVEARRRVLTEYNFFAVVSREIAKRHHPASAPAHPASVLSRHALRRKHPMIGLRHIYEKGRSRVIHALKRKG